MIVAPKPLLIARGALRQLVRFRLRSSLAVGCAALGMAAAIVSVDFAAGGREQLLNQIGRLGSNVVMVTARQDRARAGRARSSSIVTTLREQDYVTLRREVAEIVRASPIVSTSVRLKAGDLSKVSTVVGCAPDYFGIKAWPAADGALFTDADVKRSARVALLGATLATDLFGADAPVGGRVFVNRTPFVIVGVLAERGQGLDVTNEDQQIYVPLTTAMRRLTSVDYFNAIAVEIGDWNDMDRAAAAIAQLLRVRHRSSAARPDDFQVLNQKELVDTQIAASSRLAFFVRWIGWSGLLVSGLGVLAMAWVGVRDRLTEIGARRALGATSTDVFAQFAFEACTVAAIGSCAGLALGWTASRFVTARAGLPFVFDTGTATLAVISAFLMNCAFSAWPAYYAARLDPARTLKHE